MTSLNWSDLPLTSTLRTAYLEVRASYLEGANSEVDQLLLPLQLQLELPNKLAAVKKMRMKSETRYKKKKRF